MKHQKPKLISLFDSLFQDLVWNNPGIRRGENWLFFSLVWVFPEMVDLETWDWGNLAAYIGRLCDLRIWSSMHGLWKIGINARDGTAFAKM